MTERPQIAMGVAPVADALVDTPLAQDHGPGLEGPGLEGPGLEGPGLEGPAPARDQELLDWRLLPRAEHLRWPVLGGLAVVAVVTLPLWVSGSAVGVLLAVTAVLGARWLADRVIHQVASLEDGRLVVGSPTDRASADALTLGWCRSFGPLVLVHAAWRSSRVGRAREGVRLLASVYDVPLEGRLEQCSPGVGGRAPSGAALAWAVLRRPPAELLSAVGLTTVVISAGVALL